MKSSKRFKKLYQDLKTDKEVTPNKILKIILDYYYSSKTIKISEKSKFEKSNLPNKDNRLNKFLKLLLTSNNNLPSFFESLPKNEYSFYSSILNKTIKLDINKFKYNIKPKTFFTAEKPKELKFPLIGQPKLDGVQLEIRVNRNRNLCMVYSDDNCFFNTLFSKVLDILSEKCKKEYYLNIIAYKQRYNHTVKTLYYNIDTDIINTPESIDMNFHMNDIYIKGRDLTLLKRTKILNSIAKLLFNKTNLSIGLIPQIPINNYKDIEKGYLNYKLILKTPNTSNIKIYDTDITEYECVIEDIIHSNGKVDLVIIKRKNKKYSITHFEESRHIFLITNEEKLIGKKVLIKKINGKQRILRFSQLKGIKR